MIASAVTSPQRLAVITDFPEEGWPSMDLVAEMLLKHLADSDLVRASRVCAPFKRRLGFFGGPGKNFDRLANRLWHYPRYLRKHANEFDAFHLCDHSYSQLLHELPAERAGVLLHDLDTFRCLLEPEKESRPKWFRAMARRILAGLQRASVVFHISSSVREQIERHGVVDPKKLVRAPVAAAEEFYYVENASPPRRDVVDADRYLLHVGSCIPRKRIDVLLRTFAAVRMPGLKLVQVGGDFSPAQRDIITRLDLTDSIVQLRNLPRTTIADLYRSAALVLQPSDAEGFGLPVVEALACGTAVLASDIAVLREVGADASLYAPVGDVERWADSVSRILKNEITPPPLNLRLAQAAKFSWAEQARVIARTYHDLVNPAKAGVV